ncbi:MAG: hypothetical protein JW875_07670 [Spirochaetales bacterium]|nr:hypothetical protein [Spirochaetales bacterium]
MKKSVSLYAAIIAFVCIAVSCSSNLLDSIQDDIAEQKKKEALEKQEGKTPETRKPVITIFAWQGITGGTTNNPTVLFSCSAEAKAVSATGAAVISGYYISFNSTTPTLDAEGWLSDKPESITFPSINGEHTAYLWVKDSFGNMSDAAPLSITLALKPLLWNAVYLEGMSVPAHEVFILTADEPLDAAGASVSGAGTGTVALSGTGNQTITVSPSSLWTTGTHTITVTAKTALGLTASASRTFTVFNGVCVSVTGSGSVGSARQPVGNIAVGITRTQTLYPSGGEVHISQGEYTTNWADSVNRIILVDGVSLVGGYKPDWTSRDVAGYQTVIRDESSSGGTASEPNRAVGVTLGVTSDSRIEGLRIYGGGGLYSTGVYCKDSLVISDCDVFSGSTDGGANDYRIGILIMGETGNIASPEIQNCRINASGTGGGTTIAVTIGIWGSNYSCPLISDCTITGGRATNGTVGIRLEQCWQKPVVRRNKIEGGMSDNTNCIFLDNSLNTTGVDIINNLIVNGISGTDEKCKGVHTTVANVVIRNNTFVLGAGTRPEYGVFSSISSGTGVVVENNLYVISSPSHYIYGVWRESGSEYSSFKNNGFSGFTDTTRNILYNSYNQSQIDSLNSFFSTTTNAIGNAELDAAYRLTVASPDSYKTGGINGQSQGWSYMDDLSRNARSGSGETGWSMGCYEY